MGDPAASAGANGDASPAAPSSVPVSGLSSPALAVGRLARIADGSVAVHAGPADASAIVGPLSAPELVEVVGGPELVAGKRWWTVEIAALTGWAPEAEPSGGRLVDAADPASRAVDVWAGMEGPGLAPKVAGLPERVYVPNEHSDSISVIDATTYRVIKTLPAGALPEHVTPDWDLTRLYVSNYAAPYLSTIDPQAVSATAPIGARFPYNLYFTPDGSTAIVMAEDVSQMNFYDRRTWALQKSLTIPWAGIDHADFSAGGRFLLASTEAAGELVLVDTATMTIAGHVHVGGSPVDVKLSPDGSVFYVANQGRGGVSIVDPFRLREIGFLRTGAGAHGFAISRDTQRLYVANRLAGTVSVIDFASRRIVRTWRIGGSPDMLQVSTNGKELWVSDRFGTSVEVVDTTTGRVVHTIRVGFAPHGLTYFPQPGNYSVGHNGVYR